MHFQFLEQDLEHKLQQHQRAEARDKKSLQQELDEAKAERQSLGNRSLWHAELVKCNSIAHALILTRPVARATSDLQRTLKMQKAEAEAELEAVTQELESTCKHCCANVCAVF